MTEGSPRCCASSRADDAQPALEEAAAALGRIEPSQTPIARRWSAPIGGGFTMGSDDRRFPADGEGPLRLVTVSEFAIARHAVSNLQFGDFVRATGYTTDAERYGWSFVFEAFLPDETRQAIGSRVADTPWWVPVPHAIGRSPRARQHDPRPARSSRGARLLERRKAIAGGPGRGCRARRNGKWPRAAGSNKLAIPGAMN